MMESELFASFSSKLDQLHKQKDSLINQIDEDEEKIDDLKSVIKNNKNLIKKLQGKMDTCTGEKVSDDKETDASVEKGYEHCDEIKAKEEEFLFEIEQAMETISKFKTQLAPLIQAKWFDFEEDDDDEEEDEKEEEEVNEVVNL